MRDIPHTENICRHSIKGYKCYKSINGKQKYFGYGRTLIEALMIRDIASANGWVEHIPKFNPRRYIQKNNKGYNILRWINGKIRYYGFFSNLDEAIEYRDFLESNGWSTNCKFTRNQKKGVYETKSGSYEVYYYHNGKNEYYGTYRSFEEAVKVRRLCEKYNGDWNLIVEHDDDEPIEWLTGVKLRSSFEKQKNKNDYFLAKNGGIL